MQGRRYRTLGGEPYPAWHGTLAPFGAILSTGFQVGCERLLEGLDYGRWTPRDRPRPVSDRRDFVNQKLFPYLHGFKQRASGPLTILDDIAALDAESAKVLQTIRGLL